MRRIIAAAAAGTATLALAACASSATTATASRYSSVSQVVAALKRGHLPCTGGGDLAPVVKGATSETLCNFTSSETGLIDVFPGSVSNATVLQNSVSTGSQQIFSVVGLNWWVQSSRAYAKRVQAILGGRVIAGPWHPPTAAAPSAVASGAPDPAVTVCRKFNGIYPDLSAKLQADAGDPGALSADSALNKYADDMSHWSYTVTQGVDNGTTSASVQLANEFGDAGIATVQVAEPLTGVTPDVQTAIDDVNAVQEDCSTLGT